MFDLNGRVAVITGASSGLGKQMAYAFADQGADLVLLARRIEKLEELKNELEKKCVKVLAVKCDVTSTENINESASLVEKTFNPCRLYLPNSLLDAPSNTIISLSKFIPCSIKVLNS